MKKSFALGAVSGITALAIGFPLAAQFAGAQDEVSSAKGNRMFQHGSPPSQDDVRAMVDRDNAILLNIDAVVAIHKEAIQNHRIALEAAADLTDEAERDAAVKAAHEAMRLEIQAAIEANPELKEAVPMLMMGKGPHGRGKTKVMKLDLSEKLGMTAEEKGVELPERPVELRLR